MLFSPLKRQNIITHFVIVKKEALAAYWKGKFLLLGHPIAREMSHMSTGLQAAYLGQ